MVLITQHIMEAESLSEIEMELDIFVVNEAGLKNKHKIYMGYRCFKTMLQDRSQQEVK